MNEFFIPSVTGNGGLLFYNRLPTDPARPIEHFSVRVTDQNQSAECLIYGAYSALNPVPLFADMAAKWAGWSGEVSWQSLEGEFILRCTRDRWGHIFLRAEIRSGPMQNDWHVAATVIVEAGQLEDIARRAMSFFGCAPVT